MAAPDAPPVAAASAAAGDRRLLEGIDALEMSPPRAHSLRTAWALVWPKLAAVGLALAAWQAVVVSGWRPRYVLPAPLTVFERFLQDLAARQFWAAAGLTMRRAAVGFALAVLVGVVVGLAVAQFRPLRVAVGSLITGLQTMPSIAWFPLAILLFKLSESAILFVIVLGAAPSVANGLIHGIDHIPPLLLRAGRVLGARGWAAYQHVVVPAALPGFVAGLKQGWAFAWRSLMAGELIVIIGNQQSIGVRLAYTRQLSDAPGLMATMVTILLIGIVIDALFFGTLERTIRHRRGLVEVRD